MNFSRLTSQAKNLKQEIVPIYYALFDKRTPWIAKIFAGLTIAYLLSPIDLIPDFIPVLGLLDDIILVPIFIRYNIKFIPKEIIAEIKEKQLKNVRLKKHWYYAIPIIVFHLYLTYIFLKSLFPMILET